MLERLDIQSLIESKVSDFFGAAPAAIKKFALKVIRHYLHLDKLSQLLIQNSGKRGADLLDGILKSLHFSFGINKKDIEKIPPKGGLVCVSNHPLGGLDALSILRTLTFIRSDVKIVANDLLLNLGDLSEFFLPFNVYSRASAQKQNLQRINNVINEGAAVVFFPGADVSVLTWKGIEDDTWLKGPFQLASRNKCPVLPIYVNGRNSLFFYLVSLINRRASRFLLVDEIFRKTRKRIELSIGDPIEIESQYSTSEGLKKISRIVRDIVYAHKKTGITAGRIILPSDLDFGS